MVGARWCDDVVLVVHGDCNVVVLSGVDCTFDVVLQGNIEVHVGDEVGAELKENVVGVFFLLWLCCLVV